MARQIVIISAVAITAADNPLKKTLTVRTHSTNRFQDFEYFKKMNLHKKFHEMVGPGDAVYVMPFSEVPYRN
jgi:hypothetical protein